MMAAFRYMRDGGGDAGPSWLGAARSASAERYRAMDYPGLRDPDWKIVPAAFLDDGRYAGEGKTGLPVDIASASAGDSGYAAVIRFVDGRPVPVQAAAGDTGLSVSSAAADLPDSAAAFFADPAPDRIRARARAEAVAFAVIRLAPGSRPRKPVLVEWIDGRRGSFSAPVVYIGLGRAASAAVELRWGGPGAGADCFVSPMTLIEQADDSSLSLFELVEPGFSGRYLDWNACALSDGAGLDWTRGFLGGAVAKSGTTVILRGEGSRLTIDQAFAAGADRKVDLSVVQRHEGRRSYSRARYGGVVDGDATAVTRGLIDIARSAAGADAYLSSKALSLSPNARVVSLPELRIDTNDLSASHGSTIGAVGPEELFYLESRGLSPSRAKALVAAGMLGSLAEKAPDLRRERVEALVERALGGVDEEIPA